MTRYILSRLGQALLVLWATFTLAFILLQLLPGDAVLIKLQDPTLGLAADQIQQLQQAYGADAPLLSQYGTALNELLHGQLGLSLQSGVPVTDLLAENLPPTLRLALVGLIAAIVVAFVLASISFLIPFRWLRVALQSLPSLWVSIPAFWLGTVLIQMFSFQLGWVPIIAPSDLQGLLLPAITLALPISAPLAQILIRSIEQVRTQPFIAVAYAKGLPHYRVLWHHILGNALLPTLTIGGLLFGELLAGALVTETVFGRSGLGQLTQEAVNAQDSSVLQAIVILSALAYTVINIFIDILYPWLDPRLQHQQGAIS